MTQQIHVPPGTDTPHDARSDSSGESRGWFVFAGVMFIAASAINLLWGISALVNDDYFNVDELLFGDLAMWGAIYLGFAALFAVTGVLILRGSDVGIILGTVLAVIHFCSSLLSIGAYPLWTVTVLVIDGLIIYGLTVHGAGEPTST
jgi:hypothetical protein